MTVLPRIVSLLVLLALAGCSGSGSPTSPSGTSRVIALSGNLAIREMVLGEIEVVTLTIANIGNAPLTIESITGSGVLPSYSGLSWTAGTIPAGGSQAVTVTFRPMLAGTYTGSLIVTGDQTSGTNTLPYSATVLPATPFTGTWSGTQTVTECQGAGSAQQLLCSAASGSRPGGAFPLGAPMAISLNLTQQGGEVSGTLAIGTITGTVTGVVDSRGLLTLRGTATGGVFTAVIVHWSSRVIGSVMDGVAGYAVTATGLPGVGGLVTSLVLTKQ